MTARTQMFLRYCVLTERMRERGALSGDEAMEWELLRDVLFGDESCMVWLGPAGALL